MLQWSVQNICPVAHIAAPHTPLLHVCPVAHVRPHAPQFRGSEVSTLQWSVQNICPVGHVPVPHTPLLHA